MKRLVALLGLILASCAAPESQTPTTAPGATFTPQATIALTETPSGSPVILGGPTADFTPTPTLPSPTIPFWTPTPEIRGDGSPTPAIIEVTALPNATAAPGWYITDFPEAYFTPYKPMNIRDAASGDARIVGSLAGQVKRRAYAEWYHYPDGEAWLCLDPATIAGIVSGSDCHRLVALRYGGVLFGDLEVVKP